MQQNTLGNIAYEITNYLGNVNVVISDRKTYVSTSAAFKAVVLSKTDYFPFGQEISSRNVVVEDYRYGYNGIESDDETKGSGNSYTTEFRQYDPRIGRWLSLDPLMAQFPWQSPYCAFDNNPVYFTDPLGLEATADYWDSKTGKKLGSDGVIDNKNYSITEEKWKSLNVNCKNNYGTKSFQDCAVAIYGARQLTGSEESYYLSGLKEKDYNYSKNSNEMVRPENLPKTNKTGLQQSSNIETNSENNDLEKVGKLNDAIGNSTFLLGEYQTYKLASFTGRSSLQFSGISDFKQNYAVNKYYSKSPFGSTPYKFVRGLGKISTFAGPIITGGIMLNKHFDDNPLTRITTTDKIDFGVGVAGLGSALFLSSNPIGWGIGIGVGMYGIYRFCWDFEPSNNVFKINTMTRERYFEIDNTRVKNIKN